jgi:hypothetical protein
LDGAGAVSFEISEPDDVPGAVRPPDVGVRLPFWFHLTVLMVVSVSVE